MISASDNMDNPILLIVNNPIGFINPPTPPSAKIMLQRLRLPYPLKGTPANVLNKRISKPLGIQIAIEPFGMTLEDACVFGDADNDHDMVLQAGCGVAMANGSELTKSVADYITLDNDHDGITEFINQFIL